MNKLTTLPKCPDWRSNCRARDKNGNCRALVDVHFKMKRCCPFFKTEQEYQKERFKLKSQGKLHDE